MESSSRQAEGSQEIDWPTRTEVLESFDLTAAYHEAVEALTESDLKRLLTDMSPTDLKHVLSLINMHRSTGKLNSGMVRAVLAQLRRSTDPSAMSLPFRPWAHMFRTRVEHGAEVDSDLELARSRGEWIALLRHDESMLHVRSGAESMPISTALGVLSTFESAVPGILLAAIEEEPDPLPIMALAATIIPLVAHAYGQLCEGFPDVPSLPDPLSSYLDSSAGTLAGQLEKVERGIDLGFQPVSEMSDSEPLVDASAALDWAGAAQAARRAVVNLEDRRAPNDEDLEHLLAFVAEVRAVGEQLGEVLGEAVELSADALEEALTRYVARQDPNVAALRAMSLLAGPIENSGAIEHVRRLSLEVDGSSDPADLVVGLVALHDLAQAGIANREGVGLDWSLAIGWQRLVMEGLPSDIHHLTMVATAGDLIPGGLAEESLNSPEREPGVIEEPEPIDIVADPRSDIADHEPRKGADEASAQSGADAQLLTEALTPAPEDGLDHSGETIESTHRVPPGGSDRNHVVTESEAIAPEMPEVAQLQEFRAESAAVTARHRGGGGTANPVASTMPKAGPVDSDDRLIPAEVLGRGLPADPWREPSPCLHAHLIAGGREALAVHVANLRAKDAPATKALAVFAGAFGVRAERFILSMPDFAPDATETALLQMDEARVLLAGQLRLALELGYSPIGSLETLCDQAAFDGTIGEFVAEAVSLSTRGYRRRLEANSLNMPTEWRRIAEEAETLHASLSTKSVALQRASRIIHFLARDNQSLGRALRAIVNLGDALAQGTRGDDEDWMRIEDLVAQLRRQGGPDRLISQADEALSTAQQRRNPIVADARARLLEAVDDVAKLIERALELRSAHDSSVQANPGVDDTRLVALANSISHEVSETVGDAAATRLVDWFLDPRALDAAKFSSLLELCEESLSSAFEIPRDVKGQVTRGPNEAELAAVIAGRAPLDVVRGYIDKGNRYAALAFSAGHSEELDTSVDDEIQRSLSVLRRRHGEAVARADRVTARLRSLGDDDDTVRGLLATIGLYRVAVKDRFDLVLDPLEETARDGERALETVSRDLRARAERLNDAERTRIIALLDAENEPLAVEFLTLAESGEELPTVEPPSGDDFTDFFPSFVELAATNHGPKSQTVKLVRDARHAPKISNPVLADGMKAWIELATYQQGGDPATRLRRVSDVLRMLGLVPDVDPRLRDVTKTRRAGYATISVRANPIGRGSYVPSLGSQAHGIYNLTMVWQEGVSSSRLLQLVDEDLRSEANVILYFGTLSVDQRLHLRKLTARAGTDYSPLVVDDAVVAWLTLQPEAGWKATQRVTLPFTTINPYTPFAGGEVPAEMFVGREVERRRIVDPTGPMFVYGGRQLGKSALLRRIERSAGHGDAGVAVYGNVVVYVDLKAAGVGDSSPASALWQALAPRLVDVGVLKPQRTWTADNVTAGVGAWLKDDESRRLLLLLDEADNFLTADARETGATGLASFPTLQRLKGLMEQSARRFKPVFAGLHQVQRFHALPNTPVAHGGQDILIGPLRPVDAQQLVRDPLLALGYRFENEDTMWRLLLFTNNQASLIQIICEALIKHVRATPLPGSGGRVVITDKHVDEVYANREVRDLIAQRFRWTINLDPRYRMIALVTAFRSFDSAPAENFSSSELQRECEDYWPDGFSRANLSSTEFMRYLEEMTGLGVLSRQGDKFGLRSPNIRSLLGSQADIEEELVEASRTFEVAYEYNPTANRRQLESSTAAGRRRSPLPDSDLAGLVRGTRLVVGTTALGIDRVHAALELLAQERQLEILAHPPANSQPGRMHVLEMKGSDDLAEIYRRTSGTGATCVLISSPDQVQPHVDLVGPAIVQLRRWTVNALQSWPETPFETPDLRHALKRVTGGWPELIELAMAHVDAGSTPEDALAKVEESLFDKSFAQGFMNSVGLAAKVLKPWLTWFSHVDDEGRVQSLAFRVDELDEAGVEGVASEVFASLRLRDVLDETPNGWVMDAVVLQAARSALAAG